jgi:hypothetical protein
MNKIAIAWDADSSLEHYEGKRKDQTLRKEGLEMQLEAIQQGRETLQGHRKGKH